MVFAMTFAFTPFTTQADAVDEASDHRPVSADPQQKAVLDALRKEMKHAWNLDVIFVVEYLKIYQGWAWIHAWPQSADSKNKYEDMFGLFQLRGSAWEAAEIPCTEVDNPNCIDSPDFFSHLKTRFPQMPVQILPGATGQNK